METPHSKSADSNGLPKLEALDVRALFEGPARSVLARICDGDPLELEARCADTVRRRALLVSIERLTTKSMARVAFDARRRPAGLEFSTWLLAEIDQAADDLIDEDAEEDEREAEVDGDDERYAFLSAALGVEPRVARRMCVVFHDLQLVPRQVFHAVVLDQKSIEQCSRELGLEAQEVERLLRDTLTQLSVLGRSPRAADGGEFGDGE